MDELVLGLHLLMSSRHILTISYMVALGHNRLIINDLTSAGDQPLHNQKQTVQIIVNGEIYDYDRLCEEMIEKKVYQFQG